MSDDQEYEWKEVSTTITLSPEAITASKLDPQVFAEAYERAERLMMDRVNAAMFSWETADLNSLFPPPTIYDRFKSFLHSIRSRIEGVWNVIRYGKCKQCDHDYW